MFTLDTIIDGTTLTLSLVGELSNEVAHLPWESVANAFAQNPDAYKLVVVDLFAVTFTTARG